MLILCTARPDAKFDGERVIVTIPNGDSDLQIALTVHEATALSKRTGFACNSVVDACRSQAELIAFPQAAGRA